MKNKVKTQEELVNAFAESMSHELDINSHKGDWRTWDDVPAQISELDYHIDKLKSTIKRYEGSNRVFKDLESHIKEHLADCGNILLMIGNSYNLY